MTAKTTAFLICVSNEGFEASLERGKVYPVLRDTKAEKHGLRRVMDESGDSYLYPKSLFRSVSLTKSVKKALSDVAARKEKAA